MAYIALADVKAYLKIESDKTNDDAVISGLITRAQAMIDTITTRHFEAAADTTVYLDAEQDVDGKYLYFGDDICAVTSIVNGDGVAVDPAEYVLLGRHAPYYAAILKATCWTSWTYTDSPENAIAVTGRWAYSITPPDDIVQAALRLVAWLYKQRDSVGDIAAPAVSPSGQIIIPAAMPQDVRYLLNPYRRLA